MQQLMGLLLEPEKKSQASMGFELIAFTISMLPSDLVAPSSNCHSLSYRITVLITFSLILSTAVHMNLFSYSQKFIKKYSAALLLT